jgi:hypothetical protein
VTLDGRTQQHLIRARRNREVADALIGPDAHGFISPPAYEWAVVAAFYAAVHYVNAYLWEKLRHEPRNHDERTRMVASVRDLRAVFPSYSRLQELAFRARYARTFSLSPADAASAVQMNLRGIEEAVLTALNVHSI